MSSSSIVVPSASSLGATSPEVNLYRNEHGDYAGSIATALIDTATAAKADANSSLSPAPRRYYIVWADSGGTDIVNNAPGRVGYRSKLTALLRQHGDCWEEVGPTFTPITMPTSTPIYNALNRYVPSTPWSAAVGGATFASVTARIGTDLAASSHTPDVAIVGTLGITDCTGDNPTQMAVDMTTMLRAMRAALPSAWIVMNSISLTGVAHRATRTTFNATNGPNAVAALNDSKIVWLDSCSTWTEEYSGSISGSTSFVFDSHLSDVGNAALAKALHDWILSQYPIHSGSRAPRPLATFPGSFAVRFAGTLDGVQITDPSFLPGAGSWWLSIFVTLTALPAVNALGSIMASARGDTTVAGVTVYATRPDAITQYASLSVYCNGGGPAFSCNGIFRVGVRTHILICKTADGVVSAFATEMKPGGFPVFVGGVYPRPGTFPGATSGTTITLGAAFSNSISGYLDNLEAGMGASCPASLDAMRIALEARLCEGIKIPGQTLHYPLDEISGTKCWDISTTQTNMPSLTQYTIPADWAGTTAVQVGARAVNDSPKKVYDCITAGTTAGSGGPTGRGQAITDGTAVWQWRSDVGTSGAWDDPSGFTMTAGTGSTTRERRNPPLSWQHPGPLSFTSTTTATISDPSITLSDLFQCMRTVDGGTLTSAPKVTVADGSVTITYEALDTSTYTWWRVVLS